MSWPLLVAGVMTLVAASIHGGVGDKVVRGIPADALGANPFGNARNTKFLIRVAWHFTTIGFVVTGVALIGTGLRPEASAALGAARTAGALLSCWAAFALVAGLKMGGFRGWVRHPAPFLLTATAALVWWGTTWL